MKRPLQTFEPNLIGRDFVIGDLHGSLPCLDKLLVGLEFDPTVDRMFSVGDLIDRGPNSAICLSLLREPWFHSVMANHEQMMLDAFTGGPIGEFWFRNGGQWGLGAFMFSQELERLHSDPAHKLQYLSNEALEIIDLLPLVEELPFIITVNMPDGRKFHIMHAELPPGRTDITDEMLSDPASVYRLGTIHSNEGEFMLWGRFIFRDFNKVQLDNENKVKRKVANTFRNSHGPYNDKLSHIISGHTIVQRPLTILGQTNIDTCAYGACSPHPASYEALTCINLHDWKFYQATPTEFREVKPLEVNKHDVKTINDSP